LDILEQYGGLSGALRSLITIFFSVYSYRLHELNVLKEFERINKGSTNLSKSFIMAHAEMHNYWGIQYWIHDRAA